MLTQKPYWSFISYSHKDKDWGDWLHKGLETTTLPKAIQSTHQNLGKNLYPVFRDREELPGSADLGANISEALKNSATLIVICSPRSAKSLWVNQEIINYQKLSPNKPIIALVVDGDVENPHAEDYCVPEALQVLLQNNLASLVDARELGRSRSIVLKLIAEILQLNFAELNTLVRKRRQTKAALLIVVAAILALGSWQVWNLIQQAKQESLLAESERLSTIAQQALKSGDDAAALNNAILALPQNTDKPELAVNSRAAAVLSHLMSKPLLMVEHGVIAHPIRELKAIDDDNLWLLSDTQGGIHLFDLDKGEPRWSISEPNHLISAVNSQQQLIVRTSEGLKNFDLESGQLNCEVALSTRAHLGLDGSIDWMQKDWVMESLGFTQKGAPGDLIQQTYRPNQIQFINSQTCEASTLINIGFVAHIQLIDVLPDGSKITLTDTYLNGETISGFQRWPVGDQPVPEALFYLPGHAEAFVPGFHNSDKYTGPLIKTAAKENVSYVALQSNDQTGFVLSKFDWLEQKVLNQALLPGLPTKLIWHNTDQPTISVMRKGKPDSDDESNNKIQVPMASVYRTDTLERLEDTIVGGNYNRNSFSPNLEYLASLDSAINIKQLVSGESFSRITSQFIPWTNLAWLKDDTLLVAEQDGRVSSVHINQDIKIAKIKAKYCCYHSIDAEANLVQSSDGALYQFAPSQIDGTEDQPISPKLIYQPAYYQTDYRYFAEHDLLFIAEKLKSEPNTTGENQYAHKLMRVATGEVLWQKMRPEAISPNSKYLLYSEGEQRFIIDFDQVDQPRAISVPKGLLAFEYDPYAKQLIGLRHSPAYLNPVDTLLHVERYDMISNKKVADIGFDVGAVSLVDKFFIVPEQQLVAHIGQALDETKRQLNIMSLEDQSINNYGTLPDSIAYSEHFEVFDNYLKLEPAKLNGFGDTLLINRKSKQQHLFTGDDQILIEPSVLKTHHVFISNRKEKHAEVLNLADASKQQIDCPFNGALNEVMPITKHNMLALRTDSVCIVDPKTWQTWAQISATQSSSPNARFNGTQKINAMLINGENTLRALSGAEAAIDLPLQFDWRENIEKANKLLQ